jgi:hypothetical protein
MARHGTADGGYVHDAGGGLGCFDHLFHISPGICPAAGAVAGTGLL